jgi:hypothetical protein
MNGLHNNLRIAEILRQTLEVIALLTKPRKIDLVETFRSRNVLGAILIEPFTATTAFTDVKPRLPRLVGRMILMFWHRSATTLGHYRRRLSAS